MASIVDVALATENRLFLTCNSKFLRLFSFSLRKYVSPTFRSRQVVNIWINCSLARFTVEYVMRLECREDKGHLKTMYL